MEGAGVSKVVVYHASYGCDTGCCGHVVEFADESRHQFSFDHPYDQDDRDFVKELVTDTFGAEHVADIDWDEVLVSND
jgi:hypothetical protein